VYLKPLIKYYSASDILEQSGVVQAQYVETVIQANITGAVSNLGEVDTPDLEVEINAGVPDVIRAFVGFSLSTIPANSTIVSARLRVYQTYADPNTLYNETGPVLTDHVNFGDSLSAADYAEGTITPNIGAISDNANFEWKILDVASAVRSDLNDGRSVSQYRFRFTNESLTPADHFQMAFEDVGNQYSTGHLPELVVVYDQ